jgi:predicted nucleic acid-binding protein
MTVLVSDTSVLIDLERGGLLDFCFQLPFVFAVPDLLYRRELVQMDGAQLVARGLRVEELTGEELSLAQNIRSEHRKLSLPDVYAYTLAATRKWTLLTGDGALRALAQTSHIPFFGVLWVLDQCFETGIADSNTIADSLATIAAHPRCRLPRTEIQTRLTRYRKKTHFLSD